MDQIIMNKFNIGDKVWFKLDSYGRKAEMCGTIRDSLNVGDGWCYNIETSDHRHWNIKEKDINYSAPHIRDYILEYAKHDEESCKDFLNRIYGKSDFIQPFMLGDLVMYKDASRPITFTVIDVIEFKDPAGNTAYSYKIKRTNINNQNSDTIVHIVDHDRLVKVQFKGGYKYKRGEYVRFEYDGLIKAGEVIELLYADTDRGTLYKIKDYSGNEYLVSQERIKGLTGYNLNDIRKKIGMEPIKEDNNMKKQQQKKRNRNIIKTEKYQRTIKDISFNGPAVIVKFEPTSDDYAYGRFKGDKVVVVCKDGDKYDMKTGFLLAILKEFLNNQSYGNVLEKLDSFDALDIPQVGKDDGFKFKLGDIVRFEHGVARFKVDKCTTFTTKSGKVVPRYRLLRVLGTKYAYSTYASENELVLADEVYQK